MGRQQNLKELVGSNLKCEPNSFVYHLHEKHFFHHDLFDDFCEQVQAEIEAGVSNHLNGMIFKLHDFIAICLGAHKDPEDGYQISNLSHSDAIELRNDLSELIFSYLEATTLIKTK
ncbi:hypothetical protein [Marinicella sp. W31]|uniref:hypothetical protein n=1 Tax=Marinicella sp. W31 TaxID=3023713 RepID=UPI00375723A1